MRGQSELFLQIFGQETVDTGDRHEMEDRAGSPPHQDVVGQLPFDRGEEVWNAIIKQYSKTISCVFRIIIAP